MDIVKTKSQDLNARSDEAAFRIIAGTARQMVLEIVIDLGKALAVCRLNDGRFREVRVSKCLNAYQR